MNTPDEIRHCRRLEIGASAYLVVASIATAYLWPWSLGMRSAEGEPLIVGLLMGMMLSLAWNLYLSVGGYHANALESRPKPVIVVARQQSVFVIAFATVACLATLIARSDESMRSDGPGLLFTCVPFFGAVAGKIAAGLFVNDGFDDSVTLSRQEFDRLWDAAKAAERAGLVRQT